MRIKHNPQWLQNQSAAMKRAWQDPTKLVTLRHQSPELIEKRIAPLRGRKRSAEANERTAAALRGRRLSPEHRVKTLRNLRSPSELSPEAEARRRRAISIQRKGTHGYGRSARDNPKHVHAKHWVFRDPTGHVYECDNLQAWCRANESLFLPDDYPDSQLPLWRRAVSGFNGMRRTDRKGQHTWRGWVLVSVEEQEDQNRDPLSRNATDQATDQNQNERIEP